MAKIMFLGSLVEYSVVTGIPYNFSGATVGATYKLTDRVELIRTPDDFRLGSDPDDTLCLSRAFAWAMTRNGQIVADKAEYTVSSPLETITGAMQFIGHGSLNTVIRATTALAGDVISLSGTGFDWPGTDEADTIADLGDSGVTLSGFTIIGDRSAASQQNGFMLYDKNDNVFFYDLRGLFLRGHGFSSGRLKDNTKGYLRESTFIGLNFRCCGDTDTAQMEITSSGTGDASNQNDWFNTRSIHPAAGQALLIKGKDLADVGGGSVRRQRFFGLMLHGLESAPSMDPVLEIAGKVGTIEIRGFAGNAAGGWTILFSEHAGEDPLRCTIEGTITTGANGIKVEAGRSLRLALGALDVDGTEIVVEPTALGEVWYRGPHDTNFAEIAPFSLAFVGFTPDTADLTTYTEVAVALGTVVAGSYKRWTILAITSQTVASVLTATVGGLSATLVTSSGTIPAEIWIVDTSSLGTTADVVVTFNTAVGGMGLGVYHKLNGASGATPHDTSSPGHTLGVSTMTLDIPTSGVGIAVAQCRESVLSTFTWTGTATPTENYDADTDTADAASGAISTVTGADLTFIATNSDTTPAAQRAAAASWGP